MAQFGKVFFNVNRPLRIRQGGGYESDIVATSITASVTGAHYRFYDTQDAAVVVTLPQDMNRDGNFVVFKNETTGSGTLQVQDTSFAAIGPALTSSAEIHCISNGTAWKFLYTPSGSI